MCLVWTVVRPRPTQATSIPALVALFQNEWDALMVETYTLKQHLSHTRKVRHHTQLLHHACRLSVGYYGSFRVGGLGLDYGTYAHSTAYSEPGEAILYFLCFGGEHVPDLCG